MQEPCGLCGETPDSDIASQPLRRVGPLCPICGLQRSSVETEKIAGVDVQLFSGVLRDALGLLPSLSAPVPRTKPDPVTWDDGLRLHALIGLGFMVLRDGATQPEHVKRRAAEHVRGFTYRDIVSITQEERALARALLNWTCQEDTPSVEAALRPAFDRYTTWYNTRARPAMENLIRRTASAAAEAPGEG